MFKAIVPARGRYTSLNESKKTFSESAEMLAMLATIAQSGCHSGGATYMYTKGNHWSASLVSIC